MALHNLYRKLSKYELKGTADLCYAKASRVSMNLARLGMISGAVAGLAGVLAENNDVARTGYTIAAMSLVYILGLGVGELQFKKLSHFGVDEAVKETADSKTIEDKLKR